MSSSLNPITEQTEPGINDQAEFIQNFLTKKYGPEFFGDTIVLIEKGTDVIFTYKHAELDKLVESIIKHISDENYYVGRLKIVMKADNPIRVTDISESSLSDLVEAPPDDLNEGVWLVEDDQ